MHPEGSVTATQRVSRCLLGSLCDWCSAIVPCLPFGLHLLEALSRRPCHLQADLAQAQVLTACLIFVALKDRISTIVLPAMLAHALLL